MDKGITPASGGLQNMSWNVVGQTYVPKAHSPDTFIWHATIPPDTFVPPHIHPTQDEWINVLSGNLEIEFWVMCIRPDWAIRFACRWATHTAFSIVRAQNQHVCLA